MSIPERDFVRLRHMRDAARDAERFIAGQAFEAFADDRIRLLAVIKSIEILGEAASRVSEQTRAQLAAIPWRDMISMRNRLIHGYYDIDAKTVWDTVHTDLPPLIDELSRVVDRG